MLTLALCAGCADAGKSIFKLGDAVDHKPWVVMTMYFAVFLITISMELTVHHVHHTVTSDSGKHITHHVTSEIMILGGIAAVLVVFENLGGAALINTGLFHYVHFVIFLMAILFITLVTLLFRRIEGSWQKWTRFEVGLDNIEFDPSLDQGTRAAQMTTYVKAHKSGAKMASAIVFFKANLPTRLRGVSFSRYMSKMQRKFLLNFLNLHVSSWVLLGFLMLVAAIVTGITNEISDNALVTVGLWVLIIGWGSLFVLIVVFFKIRREFTDFASEVQYRSAEGRGQVRPQSDHFWRSPAFMTKIMQTMLLYQVFFLATVVTNFAYRLVQSDQTGALGWPLVFGAVAPSFFVFLVMIPAIMPPFTVLASLGEYLDHDVIVGIMAKDKASGRERRRWRREEAILAPPLYFTKKDGVLVPGEVAVRLKARSSAAVEREKKKDHQCGECIREAAVVFCQSCGFLCAACDVDYHRLKRHNAHTREPIGREMEHHFVKKKKSAGMRLLEMLAETELRQTEEQQAAARTLVAPASRRARTNALASLVKPPSTDAAAASTDYHPLVPKGSSRRGRHAPIAK